MKRQFLTIAFLAATTAAMAGGDSIVVRGCVTDHATGLPVPGVMVQAYNNRRLTAMTNGQGLYSIKVPGTVNSLTMFVEGYETLQVPVGKNPGKLNVHIYPAGFSSIYSRTTRATTVSQATDFGNTSEESIDPLIQQRLGAEVRSTTRSANAGLGNVMFVEGLNSLQANAQPLIVVDGIIADMQYNRTLLHDGYYNNLLSNINVNDIESVQVLKNGTAIYGAKGANGVILIKTKRSKSLATKIDVTINGRYDLQPRLPKMLGADDYRVYATALLADQTPDVSSLRFVNTDPTYYYYNRYHSNTDWSKEVYRDAFSSNYGINVQGGDNVASYNLSVGYSYANSTLKKNDFSRFDMRLNTDINVFRNFDVRFDASYSDVNRNLRDDGAPADVEESTITSPGFLGLIKAPFLSPYAHDVNGNVSSYLAEADDYLSEVYGSDVSLANPKSILIWGDGKNRNTFGNRMVMLTITPKYQFNRHLALSETFNFSLVNTNENLYLPITGVPKFRVQGLSGTTYVNNVAESLASHETSLTSDTRLTWSNRYGAHYFDVYGGVRYLSNSYKLTLQRGYNTGNDKTPNMSGSLQYKNTKGADDKSRDITWYGSADYNYAEKYYFTAALSAQSSSRFGSNASGLDLFGTVWGVFPSLQAAWVMSNEPWMSAIKPINYLKLSAGYDIVGNDDVDYTAGRSYFVAHRMLASSITGLELGNIGNDKLKWETTNRFTLGLQSSWLDNRVGLGFFFYKSRTSDLLTLHALAYTSGLDQNWDNNGKLENTGFDANLSLRVVDSKDWHLELGGTIGHYKNKVKALPNGNRSIETDLYQGTVLTEVGRPLGVFYGYKTQGVFATQAEADAANLHIVDENGNTKDFKAGDMHFVDRDGNHVIDKSDRTVIGDPNPDIYGNFYATLRWKHWTLNAVFNYSKGNDIYNYQRSLLEGGKYFFNQTTAMNSRWSTEGQITNVPRVEYQDPMGNSRFSDRWIEDGSYLRFRTLTLSYSIPLTLVFIKGITVWGQANNLFTATHYLGSDPDCGGNGTVLSQGIDRGLLGQGRNFAFGMKLNL